MPMRSDAPELAVDELKRRARRRLVGAIVLALAAAVILPLLLESDPKPLGDEVSIRIPPIDNGRFINPLAPDKGGSIALPAAPDSKSGAVATPRKSITDAERRILGQPAPPPAVPAVSAPNATPEATPPATAIPPPAPGAAAPKTETPAVPVPQPPAAS